VVGVQVNVEVALANELLAAHLAAEHRRPVLGVEVALADGGPALQDARRRGSFGRTFADSRLGRAAGAASGRGLRQGRQLGRRKVVLDVLLAVALVHVDLEVVVSGEALVADGAPDALLVEGVQLVLVVHVVIFAPHVAEGRLADVALVNRLGVSGGEVVSQDGGAVEHRPADVALVRVDAGARGVGVPVHLEVLLQLERLVERLAADFADGADLAGVLSHVVEEVLLLAEDVAADVAPVLNPARVNGDVLLEAVEAGELAAADAAHEKSAVVLNGGRRVGDLRNGI